MRTLRLTLAVLAGIFSVAASAQDDATLDLGRTTTEPFLTGDIGAIWDAMTPEMRAAIGTLEGLAAFRDGLGRDLGTEGEILAEEVLPDQDGIDIYQRIARWTGIDAPVLIQLGFDANDAIAAFRVQPVPVLAESRFLDYETQAQLRLPFDGEWLVVWGGRTLEQNYHAANPAQRFALDLLIVRGGTSFTDHPAVLANYHCWGAPILAPGAGTVAVVVNDLPDNAIGTTDATNPAGNHVVLDLGNGEFAFLGHMREGSIVVQPGDTVTAGDELGRCGNSGNTSEPHLHIHLQTTADLATGEGLPAFFEDYLADGVAVERGEPLQGQTIAVP